MIHNPMCLEFNPAELSQTTPCTSLIACYADTLPWYTSKEGLNSLSCASEGQNLVAHLRLECTHMAGQNHDWTCLAIGCKVKDPRSCLSVPKLSSCPKAGSRLNLTGSRLECFGRKLRLCRTHHPVSSVKVSGGDYSGESFFKVMICPSRKIVNHNDDKMVL